MFQIFSLGFSPISLSVLFGEVGREGAVVRLVEEKVFQLFVVVKRSLKLLQLGRVLQRVLLVSLLRNEQNC